MRKTAVAALMASLLIPISSWAKDVELKTPEQKFAYIQGLEIGRHLSRQLKQQGVELDMNLVTQGILDSSSGVEPRLSQEEMANTMEIVGKKMQEKQAQLMAAHEAKMKQEGEKNARAGKKFLEDNAKKDGVNTTKSGLQYKVLVKGQGRSPSETDTVTVNYRGSLIDGTEFDSSYKRGVPATFAVNAVIPGWVEALQLMKEGAKWELYIPSNLAYGPGGTGDVIGPNATLIFEVELLKANNASGD